MVETQHVLSVEETQSLTGLRQREVYVTFPQMEERSRPIPARDTFPQHIPWATTSPVEGEERSFPVVIGVKGEIIRCSVNEDGEEVEVAIRVFPPLDAVIDSARRGYAADRLYSACVRAVNIFPVGSVIVGAFFQAYFANAIFASSGHEGHGGVPNRPIIEKVVWEVRVSNGSTFVMKQLRRFLSARSWIASAQSDSLFTPAETSLVTPLHGVLSALWHDLVLNDPFILSQIVCPARSQRTQVPVKLVSGKIPFRHWKGPNLFQKS